MVKQLLRLFQRDSNQWLLFFFFPYGKKKEMRNNYCAPNPKGKQSMVKQLLLYPFGVGRKKKNSKNNKVSLKPIQIITYMTIRYDLPINCKYNSFSDFYWNGTFNDAWNALLYLSYYDEKEEENVWVFLENEKQEKRINKWKLDDILKSALFFYFEEKLSLAKYGDFNFPSAADFKLIFEFIFKPVFSDETLNFSRELNLFEIASAEIIYNGALSFFEEKNGPYLVLPEKKDAKSKSLFTILFLLNVSEKNVSFLIDQAYEKNTLSFIIDYLKNKEKNLNKNFLLNNSLKSFDDMISDGKKFYQIEEIFQELIEEQKNYLENFSVFDLLESSENFRSKAHNTESLYYYRDLIENIKDNKEYFIDIFYLFQNYVFLKRNKFVFLRDLPKEEISDLIKSFCQKNEKEVATEKQEKINSFFYLKKKNFLSYFTISLVFVVAQVLTFEYATKPKSELRIYSNIGPAMAIQKFTAQTPRIVESIEKNIRQEKVGPSRKVKVADQIAQIKKKIQLSNLQNVDIRINEGINEKLNFYDSTISYSSRKTVNNLFKNIEQEFSNVQFSRDIQWDHTVQRPVWEIAQLSYEQGTAVARPSDLHRQITKREKLIWPKHVGYGKNSGNIFDLVIYQGQEKASTLKKVNASDLYLLRNEGLILEESLKVINNATQKDLNSFKGVNIQPNFILPLGDGINLLQKATKESFRFEKNILPGQTQRLDLPLAVEHFKNGMEKTQDLHSFYYSLHGNIKQDKLATLILENSYNQFLSGLNNNMNLLNKLGANITEVERKDFLNPSCQKSLSLEELEILARDNLNLTNRKKGINSLWYFKRNFNKK